jgi:cytochrome c oxidase subunit 2
MKRRGHGKESRKVIFIERFAASRWSLVAPLAAAAFAISGCATGPRPPTPEERALLQPSGQMENGVRVIQVEAKKYAFVPEPIVVRTGEQVRLEVTSSDTKHGFAISDLKIDIKLEPGKTETVTFTAPAEGSYRIHCSVFCGLGHMGMNGHLEVLAATQ